MAMSERNLFCARRTGQASEQPTLDLYGWCLPRLDRQGHCVPFTGTFVKEEGFGGWVQAGIEKKTYIPI